MTNAWPKDSDGQTNTLLTNLEININELSHDEKKN